VLIAKVEKDVDQVEARVLACARL
jgi:hypothetical protein